jgi:hypothetical protein
MLEAMDGRNQGAMDGALPVPGGLQRLLSAAFMERFIQVPVRAMRERSERDSKLSTLEINCPS